MAVSNLETVASAAREQVEPALGRLAEYLSFPAISSKKEHAADVDRLAERIRGDLAGLGMHNARVLRLERALPAVAAEWLGAPGRPTVLIYGHLDVQPADEPEWTSRPHVPTRVGDRLYARGAADDMGGWVSHFAALQAWFAHGGPPCNVKLIIEGEEEIGSPNLERYMDAFPEVFTADVMVLTDCENPSTEIPGLTVSLRGLMDIGVTCRALGADVHSGLWGGMVPDVSIALMRLVARITDDDGRLTVGRVDVGEARRRAGHQVPLGDAEIRAGAHLIDGVAPLPLRGRSAAEWIWWQPAVTVVATTLPRVELKKNAIRREARAILSVRAAAAQPAAELYRLIEAELLRDPPGGVQVSVDVEWHGEGWLYEPKGPAFDAANRAYRKAWGHELVRIGVGGSIPFVALFGRRYGDLPLILNGVMDPLTTAHGPNESLHLGVFEKAIAANVYLLDELSRLS